MRALLFGVLRSVLLFVLVPIVVVGQLILVHVDLVSSLDAGPPLAQGVIGVLLVPCIIEGLLLTWCVRRELLAHASELLHRREERARGRALEPGLVVLEGTVRRNAFDELWLALDGENVRVEGYSLRDRRRSLFSSASRACCCCHRWCSGISSPARRRSWGSR